jgi:predicted site-specific integrase-resolvase
MVEYRHEAESIRKTARRLVQNRLALVESRAVRCLFPTDTENELVDDFVSVITSMAARIYGRRKSKRRAEQIKRCIDAAMKVEDK